MTLCCAFDNKGLAFCTHRECCHCLAIELYQVVASLQSLKEENAQIPLILALEKALLTYFPSVPLFPKFKLYQSQSAPASLLPLSFPYSYYYNMPRQLFENKDIHQHYTVVHSICSYSREARCAGEGGPMHFCTGACIDLRWNNPPKRPLRTPKTPHANGNPCSFPLYFPFCYK